MEQEVWNALYKWPSTNKKYPESCLSVNRIWLIGAVKRQQMGHKQELNIKIIHNFSWLRSCSCFISDFIGLFQFMAGKISFDILDIIVITVKCTRLNMKLCWKTVTKTTTGWHCKMEPALLCTSVLCSIVQVKQSSSTYTPDFSDRSALLLQIVYMSRADSSSSLNPDRVA